MLTLDKGLATIASIFVGAAVALPVSAAEQQSPFKAQVSVGLEYDNNIAVEELDISTTANDTALLLDFNLDYEKALDKNTTFNAGYGFSQSLFQDLDNFDIQSHLFSAGVSRDYDKTSAGVNYYYADSTLGGDGFLDFNRLSPYLSHYFSKKQFLRVAYSYTDKGFDQGIGRDATVDAIEVDFYYFINGPRNYARIGYKFESENADSERFDHDSHHIRVSWIRRIELMGRQPKLKVSWRYEQRDYDSELSANDEQRDDDRHRLAAELEYELNKKTWLTVLHEFSNYKSNLAAADYNQHLTSIRLGYKF